MDKNGVTQILDLLSDEFGKKLHKP